MTIHFSVQLRNERNESTMPNIKKNAIKMQTKPKQKEKRNKANHGNGVAVDCRFKRRMESVFRLFHCLAHFRSISNVEEF